MPYSPEMYLKAERILEKRKNRADTEAEIRADKIKSSLPEIQDIQKKLSEIGLEISQLFFYRGGDVQAKVASLCEKSKALVSKRDNILISNGYGEDALKPDYTCKTCEDTGFVEGRLCECHKQLLKDIMREHISRFAPLEKCTFENFSLDYYSEEPLENSVVPRIRAEKVLDAAMRYAQSFTLGSKNLLFLGSTGLGKTHLSLAIANVVINKGYSVCYGTGYNICEDLKAELFGREDNINYTNKEVLGTDLLILDDLGTEISNQYNIAAVYNIVNSRILSGKPTIISTNYDLDELLEKYDQRITSRITGDYTLMTLFGTDIRNMK